MHNKLKQSDEELYSPKRHIIRHRHHKSKSRSKNILVKIPENKQNTGLEASSKSVNSANASKTPITTTRKLK